MPRRSLAIAACLILLTCLLLQRHELDKARTELARIRGENEATHAASRTAERRIAELTEKLEAASAGPIRDHTTAVIAPAKEAASSATRPPPRVTKALVEARYDRAQALAKDGKAAEALEEFLWCYDVGMPRVPDFLGVRNSFLLGDIADLGKSYPAALEALRARRDQVLDVIVADPDDSSAFVDFSRLNEALNDNGQNLSLFEKLPPGDPRRQQLGVEGTLAQAHRYSEALEAKPYRSMVWLFDKTLQAPETGNFSADQLPEVRRLTRDAAISAATQNLEILVGAGQFDQAREFAAKVLRYDNTSETRQSLSAAATRAGRTDFVLP